MISRRAFIGAASALVAEAVLGFPHVRTDAGLPSQIPLADAVSKTSAKKKKDFSQFTVCIDAGHNARSSHKRVPLSPGSRETVMCETGGAAGRRSGPEYKVNLDVAKRLAIKLRARGVHVVMVRTDSKGLMSPRKRAAIANKCKADLFVRLHCDSYDTPSIHGFFTLVPAARGYQKRKRMYRKSDKAGRFIHKRMVKALGSHNRGVAVTRGLCGFNWCKRPSVLFEMAVMSNPSDDSKLASKKYRRRIASSMSDAICAWFEQRNHTAEFEAPVEKLFG